MRQYDLKFPTLFKTVTSIDEFTTNDYGSTRILYLVNAQHTGLAVAKKRCVRELTEHMLHASMDGDRYPRSDLCNRFRWNHGFKEIERDEMYANGINIVCARPGYGPCVTSQQVRDGVSISSLVAMVTTLEYLVRCLSTVDMREFPYVEKNFMFYVESTVSDILHELERFRFISSKGFFNAYKIDRIDNDAFALTIGYLHVAVHKENNSNEIRIVYDDKTERMVRDNYGDDYVYS